MEKIFMKPRVIIHLTAFALFVIPLSLIIFWCLTFTRTYSTTQIDSLKFIEEGSVTYNQQTIKFSFNHKLSNLAPRTPVTAEFTSEVAHGDSLYIKSVYAPFQIYYNDNLIFENGQIGSFPSFLTDPASSINIVKLPYADMDGRFRIEYLSPIGRDNISFTHFLVGSGTAIIAQLFREMGFTICFAIVQICLGLILAMLSLFVIPMEEKGMTFLWLGVFSFATGVWSFGECPLTVLVFDNPSLLYVMAFIGLFSIIIPLILFVLSAVNFKNDTLPRWMLYISITTLVLALTLQILKIVPFTQSMYYFHIQTPLFLSILGGYVAAEGVRYKNRFAFSYAIPIIAVAIFSILELVNYQVRFITTLSMIFQIGVAIFVLISVIIGSMYIRDLLNVSKEKQKLEFEMQLMDKSIKIQKERFALVMQNAKSVRAQRHDLRHQLVALKHYCSEGDTQGLNTYIDSMINNFETTRDVIYCENNAVNAVVTYYLAMAEAHNINFDCRLVIPEKLVNSRDGDICLIMGNLIENAIEACDRNSDRDNKTIVIRSQLNGGMLYITMDNSCNGVINKKGDRFISSKRNDFGVGLTSINSIAKKCGGGAKFQLDGMVFRSSVYFNV